MFQSPHFLFLSGVVDLGYFLDGRNIDFITCVTKTSLPNGKGYMMLGLGLSIGGILFGIIGFLL